MPNALIRHGRTRSNTKRFGWESKDAMQWLRLVVVLSSCMLWTWPGSSAAAEETKPPNRLGFWEKSTRDAPAPALTKEQQLQIEQLQAIGYVEGSEPGRDRSLIWVYDKEKTEPGLNLLVSGHRAEATLMGSDGEILHRWAYPFKAIWPRRNIPPLMSYWRRVDLQENGDLIAIYEGWGIVKVDANSQIVWTNPIRAHHDMQIMPDGRIYVLTRKAGLIPEFNPSKPVLEDFITILNAEGKLVESISVLAAIMNSPFRELYEEKAPAGTVGDVLHTNSLFVLDGRGSDRAPWLAPGNVLISMRIPSLVAVVDLSQAKVVAMWSGSFRFQHDPKILDNGNLLLFDNGDPDKGPSSVVESDPITHQVKWRYRGSEDEPFFSRFCGAAQRLPNGNTLITESSQGRAFEVTQAKEIVWEYNSPHRVGDNREFVASLLEVIRLPAEFPIEWAKPPEPEP